MARPSDTVLPICPRCGYDQSGVAATWDEVCPIEGRCPECGHGFLWADLFEPGRRDLRWYVEHAPGPRSFARRSIRTLLALLLPLRFWREMGVDRQFRPRMLLAWVAGLAVVSHLLAVVLIVFLIAAANAAAGMGGGGLFGNLALHGIEHWWVYLFNGLLWPVASFSDPVVWSFDPNPMSVVVYAHSAGFGVMWFILMAALPTTREQAKLRLAHVWRAILLQFGVVVVCMETLRVLQYASMALWLWGGSLEMVMIGVWLGMLLWTLVWWACAVRVGWGIRSWTLLVLGMIAAFLGMPVVWFPVVLVVQWLG